MKKIICLVIFCLCAAAFAGTALKQDETVEFYPAAAAVSSNGKVTAEMTGRVIEKEDHVLKEKIKGEIRSALGLTADVEKDDLFKQRLKSIFADGESGRVVTVNVLGRDFVMNRSSSGGYFSGTVSVEIEQSERVKYLSRPLIVKTVLSGKDSRQFYGRLTLAEESGISVISDIDDTIKISNVADKSELLRNTFFRGYRAVPGMAKLYSGWAAKGAVIHYVSGSPRQMFGLISDFLVQSGFPCSELVLKHADLSDGSLSSFIKADQLEYKTAEICTIMNRFPERKFILLGDSGEKDPEVYAGIIAEYPGRVSAVCIRDVSAAGETEKRIAALKKKNVQWILFNDGTDLERQGVF